MVLHESQLTGPKVDGIPLLAVEVLSPSTRATDLTLKRHVFEQAGVPSYWLLDPEAGSLLVLELVDGSYQAVATVLGNEAFHAARPFDVRVVLSELLR